MRTIVCSCFIALFVSEGIAELPDLPLSETRIPVGILVREDIFAGWRSNNMERLARAEKNIELLLEQRPEKKPELLAWKGAATLYRAILAVEADQTAEFERYFQETRDLNDQARSLGPNDVAVCAIIGGGYALFADRLPEKYRAAAWSESYDSYQVLWAQQSPYLAQLPGHIRGELLAGLIQSSQRTGRTEELDQFLDKALEVLPGTPYAKIAQKWKDDPQAAATDNISCKTCHAPRRLAAQIKRLQDN